MKTLPPDIEFLVNDEGAYIEVEAFIKFLRSEENVSDEYKNEIVHLQKIADYLEEQFAEILTQKQLMNFESDLPN